MVVTAALALAACTQAPRTVHDESRGPGPTTPPAIEALLLEAQAGKPPKSAELRLDAAEMAFEQGNRALLRWILNSVLAPYSNQRTTRDFTLLRARLALMDGDPVTATRLLDDQRFTGLPFSESLQASVGDLRARAYAADGRYLASARELAYMDKLISDEERSPHRERLFRTLLKLDEASLRKHAEKSANRDFRGWLLLATVSRQHEHDPQQQSDALTDWMKAWPDHPATTLARDILALRSPFGDQRPQHVALLLPLQGQLGKFGRAVRDGFIAAHYLQSPDTELDIYDTSRKDPASLIDLADAQGAEVIIGPLDRKHVAELAGKPLPVPVIGLNRSPDGLMNPNFYQFGLAPEDESIQVAEQVVRESRFRGLVIAPDTDWGDRNLEAFTNRLTELGGVVVDSARFTNQRNYSEMIKALLKVDASEARAQALQQLLRQEFRFTARRRQDIDFVFLLSNSRQARGINPNLAYFYAEDIPVYATSHVHEPGESRIDVIDLNGIRFCDIPWKLTRTDAVRNRIQSLWEAAKGPLAPFYALGVDAHHLYSRLGTFSQGRNARVHGATGVLTLDEGNIVRRKLMWARFRNGRVEPVVPTPDLPD